MRPVGSRRRAMAVLTNHRISIKLRNDQYARITSTAYPRYCTSPMVASLVTDLNNRQRAYLQAMLYNERAAADHGWRLGKPYRDKGSASRYASKRHAWASTMN